MGGCEGWELSVMIIRSTVMYSKSRTKGIRNNHSNLKSFVSWARATGYFTYRLEPLVYRLFHCALWARTIVLDDGRRIITSSLTDGRLTEQL